MEVKKYLKKGIEYSVKVGAVTYLGIHALAHLVPVLYLVGEKNEHFEKIFHNPLASVSFSLTLIGGTVYHFINESKEKKQIKDIEEENKELKNYNESLEGKIKYLEHEKIEGIKRYSDNLIN
jgi:hypothetical protein